MLAIKICVFIYLLVAAYVFIFQLKVLWSGYQVSEENYKKEFLKNMGICGMSAVLLWPLDFMVMPKNYIKAFLLRDSVAMAQVGIHIGKTRAVLTNCFNRTK